MLNNRLELIEKDNFELKKENKNLKKIISNSSSPQDSRELTNLRLENQKLRKMVEGFKLQSGPDLKEPSLMQNQESSLNPEFFH